MVEIFKPSEYDAAMTKLEDYITVSEFAARAGVSVQAIHKAMRAGRIRNFQRVGSIYLIDRDEMDKFRTVDSCKGRKLP